MLEACLGLEEDNSFKLTLRWVLQIAWRLGYVALVDYNNKRAFRRKKCSHLDFNQKLTPPLDSLNHMKVGGLNKRGCLIYLEENSPI